MRISRGPVARRHASKAFALPGRLVDHARHFSDFGSGMRSGNAGFTFAEVLTAIFVIAIGLIGIAALYGEGLQTDLDTQPRAQAAPLAQTIADRINANAAGRIGYASVVGVVCTPKATTTRPDSAAAQEAACWQDEIEQQLPNGTLAITRDLSTTPATFVIAVSWSSPGAGAASYVLRVQPKN